MAMGQQVAARLHVRVLAVLVALAAVAGVALALNEPTHLTAVGTRDFTVSPLSGPPGVSVTLNGTKWTPSNNFYRIFWDAKGGTALGDFTLNASGSFTKKVNIPGNATLGGHQIVACEGYPNEFQVCLSKPFTVIALPTPTAGGPPTPTRTATPVNTPPDVVFLAPFIDIITVPYVEVHVRVTEDNDLDTVTAQVLHGASSTVVGEYYFCGLLGALDRFCPSGPPFPIVYDRTSFGGISLSLPGGLKNGTYQIRVTACDAKAQCDTATRNIILNLPAPPVPVNGLKIEINQGVQSQLCEAPPLGSFNNCQRILSVIPPPIPSGKDTVVRFYLVGEGGPRPDYSARLLLHVFRLDGGSSSQYIQPNVVASASSTTPLLAQVPQDPGDDAARSRLVLEMRADPSATLNFVIPGSALQGAAAFQVELDGVTGLVQLDMIALRLGINIVRSPSGPDAASIQSAIVPYLQKMYPVSEVRVLSVRTASILVGCSIFDPCDSGDPSCDLQDAAWSLYGGGDAPARFSTSDPHYTVTLYVVSGLRGCADLGDPDDNDDRYGGVAVIDVSGEDAAHETGHLIGLQHAGCSHGEGSGGGCESGWPWPHGTLGHTSEDPPTSFDNFGVIPMPAANPTFWTVWLVDPCPAPDFASRRPTCTVDMGPVVDNLTHDIMSYGGGAVPAGFPVSAQHDQWISALTYNRIYRAICCRGGGSDQIAGYPPGTPEPRVEAYVIRGSIRPDDTGFLRPVLRKPVLESFAAAGNGGSYTLQLLGGQGNVLSERSFEPKEGVDSLDKQIREIMPYVAGVRRIVVRHGATVVIDRTASANAPQVHVVTPNGGESLGSATQTVQWEASDADGDPLWFTVQYSPDGGQTWEGVAVVSPGQPYEAALRGDELTPGSQGVVRVTASDAFNTATDESDCPFSLGSDAGPPAPCQPQPTPTPSGLIGDANCDHSVNAIDAAVVLQFAAGLVSSLPCQDAANANRDGSVNAIDAALILQYGAGLLNHLPPGAAGWAFVQRLGW